jgi:hypothetical protein
MHQALIYSLDVKSLIAAFFQKIAETAETFKIKPIRLILAGHYI